METKNPKIKNPRQIVTGIKHWNRKDNGEDYTIICYSIPIPSQFGIGVEGKQCYLSGKVENVEIGDSILLNFVSSNSGKYYVKSVTVLNR